MRLGAADYRKMPWKNGGGVTTEIVVEPPSGRLSDARFSYRVSVADVASDGPFSAFPGCDRHIMLLSGDGMTLDVDGTWHELRAFAPFSFSGDARVHGALHGGPVRDFNVIVDRASFRATLTSQLVAANAPCTLSCPPGATLLVYVIAGHLVGRYAAAPGETLVLQEPALVAAHAVTSETGGTLARLAIALLAPGESCDSSTQ